MGYYWLLLVLDLLLQTKMDKKSAILKNILDLSYRRNLQLLNAVLIIGLGSFVAYFIGLVLNPNKLIQYTLIVIVLAVVSYTFYYKINRNLRNISNKIGKLI